MKDDLLCTHTLQQCNHHLFSRNLCHHLLISTTHLRRMPTQLLQQPQLLMGKMPKPLPTPTQPCLIYWFRHVRLCRAMSPSRCRAAGGGHHPAKRRKTLQEAQNLVDPSSIELGPSWSMLIYVDSMTSYLTVNSRDLLWKITNANSKISIETALGFSAADATDILPSFTGSLAPFGFVTRYTMSFCC